MMFLYTCERVIIAQLILPYRRYESDQVSFSLLLLATDTTHYGNYRSMRVCDFVVGKLLHSHGWTLQAPLGQFIFNLFQKGRRTLLNDLTDA